MLDADDWAQMLADRLDLIGDNATQITLRRGQETLAAQTVRLTHGGASGRVTEGRQTQENRSRVLVWGAATLDIRPEDRFTMQGVLYRVITVRSNRRSGVVAEAEQVA